MYKSDNCWFLWSLLLFRERTDDIPTCKKYGSTYVTQTSFKYIKHLKKILDLYFYQSHNIFTVNDFQCLFMKMCIYKW